MCAYGAGAQCFNWGLPCWEREEVKVPEPQKKESLVEAEENLRKVLRESARGHAASVASALGISMA